MRLLLNFGADVSAVNAEGYTARTLRYSAVEYPLPPRPLVAEALMVPPVRSLRAAE
jgi:hypothetical protein